MTKRDCNKAAGTTRHNRSCTHPERGETATADQSAAVDPEQQLAAMVLH